MVSVIYASSFPLHSSSVDSPSIVLPALHTLHQQHQQTSIVKEQKEQNTEIEQRLAKRQKISNYDKDDAVLDLTVESDQTIIPDDGRPMQTHAVTSSSSSSSWSETPLQRQHTVDQSQSTLSSSTTSECPICMQQVLKSRLPDHASACFENMQRAYISQQPPTQTTTATNDIQATIQVPCPLNDCLSPISTPSRPRSVPSNQSACAQAEEATAAMAFSSATRNCSERKLLTTASTLADQSMIIDISSSDDANDGLERNECFNHTSSSIHCQKRDVLDEVDSYPMKFMQLDDALAKEMQRIQSCESASSSSSSSSSSPSSNLSHSLLVSFRSEMRVLYGIHRNEVDELKREVASLRSIQNSLADDFTRERLMMEERANGLSKQQQEQLSRIRIEEMTRREADTEQLRRSFELKEQGFKQELRMLSDNKQALMAGEEEAIATGVGELKRIVLKPNRNFDGHTSDEFHFRLAESQFYRMCQMSNGGMTTQYRITRVEYILNPPLLKRFHDFKKEAIARGETCEDYITWHGTSGEALDKIVKEGFKIGGVDPGVPVASGAALGHGIYTSESPTFAMGYMRIHKNSSRLLFARVCRTKDSVVQYEGKSKIIQQLVSKHKEQVYPQYVVHFTEHGNSNMYGNSNRIFPRTKTRLSYSMSSAAATQSLQNAAAASAMMPWTSSANVIAVPVFSPSATLTSSLAVPQPTFKKLRKRKDNSTPSASASAANPTSRVSPNVQSSVPAVPAPPSSIVRRSSRNRTTLPLGSDPNFVMPWASTPVFNSPFDPTDPLAMNW